MVDFSLIIPAFIAGLLTFLAPCTLPLVPGYLGFISGVSLKDLSDPEKAKRTRWKIFLNGLFFVVGFSLIFIFLGTLAGLGGQALFPYRIWMARIGGIFVIIFGLFMLHPHTNPLIRDFLSILFLPLEKLINKFKTIIGVGVNVLNIPFFKKSTQVRIPSFFQRGKTINSLLLGSAFGLGWTPCVGPILGSILTLAATGGTVGQGAFLLSVFSLGLAIPFLIIALSIGSASAYLNKISKYLNAISIVGGIFLIFLGILLLTNTLGVWISYFYRLFDFINYDALLNYL